MRHTHTHTHTWCAVTEKWILAPNLRVTELQFTDHMKLRKKEDQTVGALVLPRRQNKILRVGNTETPIKPLFNEDTLPPTLQLQPACLTFPYTGDI